MPLISLGFYLCLSTPLPNATYLKGVNLHEVVFVLKGAGQLLRGAE